MSPQEKELLKLSEKLISLNTVSNLSTKECAEFIQEELRPLGFDIQLVSDTIQGIEKVQVVASKGPDVEGGLLLSGHMDVVPFEGQAGWTKDPLKLTLEDDKLFGRGTCDMKLFIAHCLQAFKQIPLNKLKKPIVCFFTCDEEIGCLGAKRVSPLLQKILKERPLPQKAIIGEPTHFEIVNAHKGITHFSVRINGVGGHSSRPDLGQNAIQPVREILEIMEALNLEFAAKYPSEMKKLFPDFPMNFLHIAQVHGGLASNMIPEECVLNFSYRSLPGENELYVYQIFKQRLQASSFGKNLEFYDIVSVPALSPQRHPQLIELLKELTQNQDTTSVSFATDASYLAQLGIQSFVCGPGEVKMAHKPDEYIGLQDFSSGTSFVEQLRRKQLF